MFTASRILAVDDDPINLSVIEETLLGKYQLRTSASGSEALQIASDFLPDVVLLDAMMPHIDGFEVCSRMKNDSRLSHSQIIMVSARNALEDRLRGYQAGADDYVAKPFHEEELLAKVNSVLRNQAAGHMLRSEIHHLCGATCEALELVSHLRDKETGEHLDRIRVYSCLLASMLRTGPHSDQIDDLFISCLYRASALHDIGKIAVSDAILNKPGPLTPDEREEMEQHTIQGEEILNCIGRQQWEPNLFKMAAEIARSHHERFDGAGYPDQLKGEEIPLAARIVKVVDVFDALSSRRVYKPAYPFWQVKDLMQKGKGLEFDPAIIDAMLTNFEQFVAIGRSKGSAATHTNLDSILNVLRNKS